MTDNIFEDFKLAYDKTLNLPSLDWDDCVLYRAAFEYHTKERNRIFAELVQLFNDNETKK